MLREFSLPAACPPEGSNAFRQSIPDGWMSQLVVLGLGEEVRNVSMLQLEHRPTIRGANSLEELLSPRSGRAMPEGCRREIHKERLVIGAHQDIPVVDVSLRDARVVN